MPKIDAVNMSDNRSFNVKCLNMENRLIFRGNEQRIAEYYCDPVC